MMIRNWKLETGNWKLNLGQSLIELVVAFGVTTLVIPALLTLMVSSREGRPQQTQKVQAVALAKEAAEATRSVRERSWSEFAQNGTFYPSVSSGSWILVYTTSGETIGSFTRKITISDVYRNPAVTGPIVQSGGTLDPSTKKVTILVSWNTPFASSVADTLYFSRYKNAAHIDTTVGEFSAGVLSGVVINPASPASADGEVTLGAGGGGGDWCQPSLQITTVDLSRQGVPTSVWAFEAGNSTGNRVFAGTGQNASGPTFTNTKITGNSPPSATSLGEFNNTKANGIFGDLAYAYLATDDNSEEIMILDLNQFTDPPTNSKYKKVGSFNSSGSTDANSIFVVGNTGFMTAGTKFYAFDLSSKIGSRSQLGSTITLAGTGVKMYIVGGYAYVAIAGSTTKMQIIDVSSPSSLSSSSIKGSITSSQINSGDARDVYVNSTGTRAYLATAGSSTQNEFFIINVSNKSSPSLVSGGIYDTSGMDPKGVVAVTGNRIIIVGTGGTKQYQVINIQTESANPLPSCGVGLAISGGVNAVSSILQSDGYAYSYIVTGDTHAELKIILGGAGGQHIPSGTFESAIFNPGFQTIYNRITAMVSQPSSTTIKLQVAVANLVGGSCGAFTYLGPGGDPGQFFTPGSDPTIIEGPVPIITSGNYANPGQCFRYKVWLSTSDVLAAPVLYDVTVNYSP